MVYAGRLPSSESLSAISAERNPVPPEISFTAWFSPKLGKGDWRVKVTCILDTGAGESYWLSGTHPWSATRKSVPSEVVLPDGSHVAVGHELRGFLRLQEEKSVVPVSFNVLAGSQGTSSRKQDPRRVLVGRQLIQTLGVKVLMPSAWLNYEEKKTTLGDLLVAQVYEDEEVSWSALPKGLEPLVPPSTDSSDVVLRVTKVEAKEIESILQGLPTGWTPVPRCPGFFFRYRRLLPVEIIDIPQQWMATELRFPDDVKHTRVGSYSATLFNKLSVTQKETFRRLVQEYLDKKWWVEVKDPCLYEGNPLTANVFMLGGGESKRKARLVCDFRSANGALSKVSSEVPDISATFALLTILSPKVLLVGDFTAAFYHVRLWGVRVCLIAAFARYLSNRLTFGLSIGPGGLGASLNPPLDEFRSVFLSEVIRLFVDDYLIAGYSPEDAVRDLAYWISGLSALGQHTPLRKFYAAAGEKLRKILEDEFKKRGLLYTPVAQGRYLGVRFCFSREETEERLSFSCERSERSQKARAVIKQIIEEGVFTRRELFRLAGQIGFDPLGRHGVLRALADCLRSVAGSAGSTWDDRVSLRSAPYQAVYPLLIWVEDIYANEAGDCVHLVAPGPPEAGVICLRAASDSSLLGAGYVVNYLYGSEEILLREHCWRWKVAEGSWHSNRRELAALHKCLQAVADIVDGCKEYAKKNNLHFDIVLLTDNKPSSQWLSRSTFGGVSRSRALERRALDRLLNACAEECHDIRHQVPGTSIRVEHVEGAQNEHPDRLSRIFYRQCGTIDGRKVVIGDLLNTTEVVDDEAVAMGDTSCVEKTFVVHDPVQWVQEGVNSPASAVLVTDTVCSLTSVCAQRDDGSGYGLAERWAADSYDVDSILRKVRLMKTILRRWWSAARRAPRQEASSITEYDVEGDVKIIARSAQACLNNKARERLLRGGSPMVEEDGILYFQLGSATGKPFKQIYIPVECRCLRKTILHDGHRRCGHGGREATLAMVDMFYFPSCGKELRALIYKCIPCRLNRAKLQRRSPPSMSKDEESLLLNEQPYWSVDVDVLHLGGYVKLLVVVCRATGHCTLVKLTKEDGPSVLKCLQKLLGMMGVHQSGWIWMKKYGDMKKIFPSRAEFLDVVTRSDRAVWREGGV
ncbi:hypothetical protein FOZ60_006656 [Perkinsus olseni]|uniref:Integrase zinc-binding domain-containing protein n=1 Tax=Perkinsus olseni TaxID=32597 RepID=A0A7J6NNC5_PEROL|nr:hypothetical protein FOZ60_006656 [Perkinsus olseni]